MDTIEKTSPNLRYLQTTTAMRNESGHFVRVVPGDAFQMDWAGRGAAFGDIDNDGDMDVVVSNAAQKAYVLRNDGGNRNNWIVIETMARSRIATGLEAALEWCPHPD